VSFTQYPFYGYSKQPSLRKKDAQPVAMGNWFLHALFMAAYRAMKKSPKPSLGAR